MKKHKSWRKISILILVCIYLTFPYEISKTSSKNINDTDLSWYDIENQPPEALIQLELWINTKTFKVNDQVKTSDVSPTIKDGRTLVPIRIISEGLGADVVWNVTERKVYIDQEALEGVQRVILSIGDKNFYVNGIQKQMDVPPQIINNRTMVPIRAVSESLACKVYWDSKEKKVTVKGLNLTSDVDKDGLAFKEEYIFDTNPNEKDNVQFYKAFAEPNSDYAFEEGTPYMADVNGDLKIDKIDYDIIKSAKKLTPKDALWNYKCDIDGNKIIDGKDLLGVYANIGKEYKLSGLLNRFNSAEFKDSFVKYILSKIIASEKDIDSDDVQNYLDLLINNKEKKQKIDFLLKNGFSWEDGVQSNLEKQIISQYLADAIDENLTMQLQIFYLDEIEKRFSGIKNEILSIPEFNSNFESLEALEDIYGQATRSETYGKFEDRFDSLKITRAKEIWEAFDLMLKGGHLYDERKPNKEKIFIMAKTLNIDGKEDDWDEIKDYTYSINDFEGDQEEKGLDLIYLRYTIDEENLYFVFKTLSNPSQSRDIQYFIHMDDGKQLGGVNEFSINFHFNTKEAGLYNNETQRYYPVETAINDVLEMKIPLRYFETEDATKLGILDAGIYLTSTQDFADKIFDSVIVEDLLQDFSYDIAKYNFQLQGLFQLCLDNELFEKDTTAFAISMVNALYRAMGDLEVQRQLRSDDNEMLIFSRELQRFLKQQNVTWDFNNYPLEEKIAWAWRGSHTITDGLYRLVNRYYQNGACNNNACSIANFIDKTKEKISLHEYQWNNVKIQTLREMQKEMRTKGWLSSTPSDTIDNIRKRMHLGYNTNLIWRIAYICKLIEIEGGTYQACALNSANIEWEIYKKDGKGIGNCQDNTIFTEALLQSVGIPALSSQWRIVNLVRDNYGRIIGFNHDGHCIPMYYDQNTHKWKFSSVEIETHWSTFKESAYYGFFIFTPPLKLQGYFQKIDATKSGIPPIVEISFLSDNNAWKQFYNLSYDTFRRFLSGGLYNIEFKKIIEKQDFEWRY